MRISLAHWIFILALSCSACAPVAPRKVELFTSPPIGQVVTKGVGEELVQQVTGVLTPAIQILEATSVENRILAAGEYEVQNEWPDGIMFYSAEEYYLLKPDQKKICLFGTEKCATVKATITKKLRVLHPSEQGQYQQIQQTLLYNGKIGSRITFGYREFSNGLARPAFSNNVDYDLSESMMIGYRGAKLEVIKATNTDITYKVISGFVN